ncbi:MAG: negative transcriptional regulator [Cereibacter sphaeroides]|uniref:Negative transcriptional regulator n=1 Tax=Cereibacter sphaeroides TaxID=1063 RepID=A0A2W5RXQ5_CERSP|nr:MAG: negative transcriptional regulator [Cereibacter sphaeroides]
MHPNPAFRQTPADANLSFARERGFGVLTINGAEGPLASHVPFLMSDDGAMVDLHLARSNPIARAALPVPALLAISGPDGYISPDWYGMEDQVPTWNYVAVHLRGTLSPLPPESLRGHLDALSARFEAELLPKKPWTSDKMSEGSMERMMRMILPFRLTITSVDGTWKFSQNKPEEARLSAAEALGRRKGEAAVSVLARMMREAN